VVPVAGGLLILIADTIDADDGWERYDLRASVVVKTPAAWNDLTQAFRELRSALITQPGSAPVLSRGYALAPTS